MTGNPFQPGAAFRRIGPDGVPVDFYLERKDGLEKHEGVEGTAVV